MGRSQRHMLLVQNSTSAGEVHAQGEVAPGVVIQAGGGPIIQQKLKSTPRNAPRSLEDVVVPGGPPGGPLQGSSMMGAIPESVASPLPPDPELAPTLNSLDPTSAAIGSADLTLRCIGTKFNTGSMIVFNGGYERTLFVSDTEVTTIVKPSLAGAAITVPVLVHNPDSQRSTSVDFTFTEAEVPEVLTQTAETTVQHTIRAIDDHADGLAIMLNSSDEFEEGTIGIKKGDRVRVEATGNTNVNGEYTVYTQDGTTIVVDNNYVLLSPIVNKGRVTVIEES